MPQLQRLELIVSSGGSVNLLEGNQWELFINQHLPFLSIFNFKFHLLRIHHENYNEKNILAPFRSSFWLNRNPAWYVGYNVDDLILYTIPYFVSHTMKNSSSSISPDCTTLPLEQYSIYYNQVKELELDANCKSSYRYTQIQRLILSISTIDKSVLDLSTVEYLSVRSSSWSLKKLSQIIKNAMPRLYHLEVQYKFSINELYGVVPLEQIRVLDLPQFSGLVNTDNMDLSSLFPHVEYLTMRLDNIHQMVHLINRFRRLCSASFHFTNDSNAIVRIFTESDMICKWLREKSNRLARDDSFTCRLDSQSDVWIHLWISNEYIEPKTKLTNTTFRDEPLTTHRETDCQCGCSLQ